MKSDYDIRFIGMEPVAEMSKDANPFPIIRGTAPVFNAISEVLFDPNIGPFREVIESQALDKLFEKGTPDCRARFDHKILLGRTKSGTLQLTKTDAGIEYTIFVNANDPEGIGAYEKVRRGDADGSSFMFVSVPESESWEMQDGIPLRRVREISEFMDVGPVTFPAYPQTSANARSKMQTLLQQQPSPTASEGAEGGTPQARQKAGQDARTLDLMAMEIEIDQTKE
jgi:uncharacterized protein